MRRKISFGVSSGVGVAVLGAAVMTAGIGNCGASVLFNVNFSNDTVGSQPATASYVPGVTSIDPTAIYTTSGSYTATVESSVGGLTGTPVQLQSNNDGNPGYQPQLAFNIPTAITTGTVSISWQSEMTAYTPPTSGTAESDVTFRAGGPTGLFISPQYTWIQNTNSSVYGGVIQTQLGTDQTVSGANVNWTVNGGVDNFSLVFSLSTDQYTLSRNGSPIITGALGSSASAGFNSFSILGGSALGGSNGQWTAGVDNIVIATPEPAALGLMIPAGAGLLLLGRKRKTA